MCPRKSWPGAAPSGIGIRHGFHSLLVVGLLKFMFLGLAVDNARHASQHRRSCLRDPSPRFFARATVRYDAHLRKRNRVTISHHPRTSSSSSLVPLPSLPVARGYPILACSSTLWFGGFQCEVCEITTIVARLLGPGAFAFAFTLARRRVELAEAARPLATVLVHPSSEFSYSLISAGEVPLQRCPQQVVRPFFVAHHGRILDDMVHHSSGQDADQQRLL